MWGKVAEKCKSCSKSQVKKDAKCQVAEAEAMGMDDTLMDADVTQAEETVTAPKNNWFCMYQVILLQEDFVNEKPLLWHYLKGQGHVCMFLPKFPCKLNLIKTVWGYAKYCKTFHSSYHLLHYSI